MAESSQPSQFTHQQIEQLQNQIREFKNLSKRYNDSIIPKTIENGDAKTEYHRSQPVQSQIPQQQIQVQQPRQSIPNQTLNSSQHVPLQQPVQFYSQPTMPPLAPQPPAQPALSWQCFNSLLFVGTNRQGGDGMIGLASSDVGCFSKSASLPLVLTLPYASTIREKYLTAHLSTSNDAHDSRQNQLMMLQRQARATFADQYCQARKDPVTLALLPVHPPPAYGPGGYMTDLTSRRNFLRTKKVSRRDNRQWDREEKRRKQLEDDRRKKKTLDFSRTLLAHRDEFLRYHKYRKQEQTRVARVVKQFVDNLDARREKEETKAEMRRIQALKENDMESYMTLLQQTKNVRLHYLLNETDTYMAAINKLIQQQRTSDEDDQPAVSTAHDMNGDTDTDTATALTGTLPQPSCDGADVEVSESSASRQAEGGRQAAVTAGPSKSATLTSASKNYMMSTHRTVEQVCQPRMLKGGDLKEYQLAGLQWLVSLYNNGLNGILADEMGLGKTIQAIALLAYVMEVKKNKGPFLIVVPLTTLSNWVNEANKWVPDMIKVVYKGTPQTRKAIFRDEVEAGRFNVLLTTYEYIMKDKAQLRKLQWQYIIVDEGHRMKNAQGKFAQTLGTAYHSKNRLLLTGTPLQNNLPELWSLLNFLLPTIFSSLDTFDQWFNKPFAAFRTQQQQAQTEEGGEAVVLSQEEQMLIIHRLHEVLRPFVLRRVKLQVLDQLPEKIEKVVRCDLSGWQKKMYRAIYTRGLAAKDGGGLGGGLNNVWMQLRKVCNHPYLFLADYAVDEDLVRSSGKFDLLDKMLPKLRAAGHRVLMFSQMTQLMTVLEQFFALRGFSHLRLDGSTSSEDREKRMFQFNDPNSPYFIFLLSTRAGGLGLNLATADTVIIFDSDWNPMMDAQAQDRAHRIGQRNEVRVFRLITTSAIEERILARATDKKNLNGLVVEAGKFNNRGAGGSQTGDSKAMMESLLREWATGGDGGTGEEGAGEGEESLVADDELLNELMAVHSSELELYQQMDRQQLVSKSSDWLRWHAERGITGANVPALPPRLMEAHTPPPWLTPALWLPKHQSIMTLMNNKEFGKSTAGKMALGGAANKAGFGFEASKKRGRRKKGEGDESEGCRDDLATLYEQEQDMQGLAEEEGVVVAGKLMRKRKEVMYDDGMTDAQYSRFVEAQGDELDAVPPPPVVLAVPRKPAAAAIAAVAPVTSAMPASLCAVLTKIIAAILKVQNAYGAPLCTLFKEKPDKKIYPDYYALIPHPISLKCIAAKVKGGTYSCIAAIENDFALMSDNARIYNMDTSPVFADCEQVRQEFFTRTLQLRREYCGAEEEDEMTPLPHKGHMLHSPAALLAAQDSLRQALDDQQQAADGGHATLGRKKMKVSGKPRQSRDKDKDDTVKRGRPKTVAEKTKKSATTGTVTVTKPRSLVLSISRAPANKNNFVQQTKEADEEDEEEDQDGGHYGHDEDNQEGEDDEDGEEACLLGDDQDEDDEEAGVEAGEEGAAPLSEDDGYGDPQVQNDNSSDDDNDSIY